MQYLTHTMKRPIFLLLLILLQGAGTNAQIVLYSRYDCELILSKGAVYRDGYAGNCEYLTQKSMSFLYANENPTTFRFSSVRSMTSKENGYAQYWLQNIHQLDTASMMSNHNLVESILTSAINTAGGYAMETTRGGETILVLVYVSEDGRQFGMTYPISRPRHEPYELWHTY